MKNLILFFLLAFTLGCKKDDIITYQGTDGISFYTNYFTNIDSVNYSFALQPQVKERDTIFIPMRLEGKPAAVDRNIKLRALPGSTARAGIDYSLADIKLPANQLKVNYPLVIYNTPEMSTTNFKLILAVDPSSELVAGAPGLATDQSRNFAQMKVQITNLLIRPAYWDFIEYAFGSFSVTKIQFMIRVTGLNNFGPDALNFAATLNMQVQLRNALAEYERVNGPLIDETGNQVSF